MRVAAVTAAILLLAANVTLPNRSWSATPSGQVYSFTDAVRHGVVDFVVNPWSHDSYDHLLDSLRTLNPGLVNRLGFQYGGVTRKKLDYTAQFAKRIRAILPQARIGGGFPENLTAAYSETLPCDDDADLQHFSRPDLTGSPAGSGGKYFWIDPSLVAAQRYYVCIGKAQVRAGFDHLHFEESDNVIKRSALPSGAIAGYVRVREELISYGKSRGVSVSFSGEPTLATDMPLDAVYIPARFYELTFDTEYRNKVETGVGDGYTYVLSPAIVEHYVSLVPRQTTVMFYIDNFDYKQDDLRHEASRVFRRGFGLSHATISRLSVAA